MKRKLEWCSVGPGGTGYFWGSHGCTLGDHANGDPHLHRCEDGVPEDGEQVDVQECSEYDDRTGMVRFKVDSGWNPWKPWPAGAWWQ